MYVCGISWIGCLPHVKQEGSKSHLVMSTKRLTSKQYLPKTTAQPESINQSYFILIDKAVSAFHIIPHP